MRRRNQGEKSSHWISGAQIVLKKQKASKIARRDQHTKLDRNRTNQLRRAHVGYVVQRPQYQYRTIVFLPVMKKL